MNRFIATYSVISENRANRLKPIPTMLYLSRKEGESIIINNTIELTVVEVRGRTVKLGFVFPPEASILRKELFDKIKQQNIAAAQSDFDPNALDFTIDLTLPPDAGDKE